MNQISRIILGKLVLLLTFLTYPIIAEEEQNPYIWIEWEKNSQAVEYQLQIADSVKFLGILYQAKTKDTTLRIATNPNFRYGRIAAIDQFGIRGYYSDVFEIEQRIVEPKKPIPVQPLPGNFLPASHLITLDVIEGKAKGWSTYYKINDGKWFNYQGGIHLQKEGSNVIQYYSEDRLGNREKMKTVEYILDSEAPLAEYVFTNTYIDHEKFLYTSRNSKIEIKIKDLLSGIESAKVYLRTGNDFKEIDWDTKEGISIPEQFSDRTIELFITTSDRLGNTKTYSKFFRHDITPPEVRADILSSFDGIKRQIYISQIEAKDSCSGVQNIFYSINGGESQVYIEPIRFSDPGEYELKFYAIDNMGNQSRTQFEVMHIRDPQKAKKAVK